MNHIRARIDERLRDETRIKRLLILEKARRRISKNDLVFVALSTIAQYYWCGMKAVFQSRQEEPAVFASHLEGRLLHAHRLGIIDDLPDSDAALLTLGNALTFDNMQWDRYVVVGAPEIQEARVSREEAERVLRDFGKVDSGWLPPAPRPGKCKECEFRRGCPLRSSLSDSALQMSRIVIWGKSDSTRASRMPMTMRERLL